MSKRESISFRGLTRTPYRIQRLARIFAVLAAHGFGYLEHYLKFRGLAPRISQIVRRTKVSAKDIERLKPARRIVMVLEELGPTYIKLGQLLSTRPDIIPDEYIEELAHLQDEVPPFDPLKAREIIEYELGRPIESLFQNFSETPIAAGSIAQVHSARLKTGEEVVVKVKRPRIDRIIRDDLDLLRLLAERAENVEELQIYRPMMLLDEFRKSLEKEMDFVTEASYTDKFYTAFKDNPKIHIPKVYWEYSTPAVLTLQRLTGTPIGHFKELKEKGIDLKQVADNLGNAFLHQYFEMGLFHADPHPGNMFVKDDCSVCLLDFGMVGHLDDELRSDLSMMVIELVRKDLDTVVDISTEIGAIPEDADLAELKSDMVQMLDKYYGIPIKHVNISHAFADTMHVARQHGLVLPRDFVLLGKSFVTVNSLNMSLNPELDVVKLVKPYSRKLIYDKFSPKTLSKGAIAHTWQASNILRRLPRDIRRLSRQMVGGKLQLFLKLRGLEDVANELESATNRIAFSVIVASVVIGSSLVIHAKMRPFFSDIPHFGERFAEVLPELSLIGFSGFLLAAVMGMILAIAIWRSGKL